MQNRGATPPVVWRIGGRRGYPVWGMLLRRRADPTHRVGIQHDARHNLEDRKPWVF